jgi:GT2 family glycosyltransferase
MGSRCSLVVVNYKTASLAAEAIRSARAASSAPLQVVVVDNSVDEVQADALRPHADILIASVENRGYAAAINQARRACDGDVLLVCNADVKFERQAIDRLLDADAAVAGPALFWDDAFEWRLPPSELHTAAQTLDRALATRSAMWRRRRDRRRVLQRIGFWKLRNPTPTRAISGAVMAVRTRTFDRLGGFDEQFRLYFEENDFLRRAGDGIVYVPTARCRHLYNQSAALSPEAAATYARSESEYLRKWNGAWLAQVAKKLERRPVEADVQPLPESLRVDREDVIVEASPLPDFDTAAGHFPARPAVQIPAEVWAAYRGRVLYLRVVQRDTGEVVAMYAKARIPA